MYTQTILVALLAAAVEARFGQEQGNGAIAAIGALTDLGSSGQAATLAGGSIQFLLAAANPCGSKYSSACPYYVIKADTAQNSPKPIRSSRNWEPVMQPLQPLVALSPLSKTSTLSLSASHPSVRTRPYPRPPLFVGSFL
jgi:hypothetical protein